MASLICDVPELAFEIVGRIVRPDVLDEGHGLGHHAVARMHVRVLEQLEVGGEPARSDTEHETALAHVIELGGLGGDDRRMVIGQVDHGGAERDVLGSRERGLRRTSAARGSARWSPRSARPATARRSRADRPAATFRCLPRACSRTMRSGGWTGIMNIPRRMQSSRRIAVTYGAGRIAGLWRSGPSFRGAP